MEFLVGLGVQIGFSHVIYLVKNASEVGWTVEVNILQAVFVVSDHIVNAVDSWIEDVSI